MKFSPQVLLRWLAGPWPVVYVLPWLIVVLVIGTVAQRYVGLLEAQRLFLTSWLVWIGPLPLPGTYPVLGVLAAGLIAKLLTASDWNREQSGIHLAHIGALLLLIGGLVTALTAEEGYITLAQGETRASVSDYHQRELAIFKSDALLAEIPHPSLQAGQTVLAEKLPFTLTVQTVCRNCTPQLHENAGSEYRGIAARLSLIPAAPELEDENNQAGAVFAIAGAGDEQDGTYLVYEPTPHQPEITVGEDVYRIALRKHERPLPFAVRLEKFSKFTHPGTAMAREYESEVTIIEASGLEWKQAIRMNEPLRTHGYTLYQSSFIDARGEPLSVLAVVKNKGFAFPYIASLIMAVGLIWQVRVRARRVADA